VNIVEALAADPHLATLPQLGRAALGHAFEEVDFADGDVFMRQGELGDSVLLVLDGTVAVSTDAAGQVNTLGPGALVGLVALVDFEPRSATVTASGPVRAARLTRERFAKLAANDPTVGVALRLAVGTQLARDFRNIEGRTLALLGGRDAVAGGAGPIVHDYDVVVIGGGPLGMAYGQWLRRFRPDTRVAIIERKPVPGYKIGEALLGGTVRALLSLGIGRSQLRRLLANKFGMAFWWTGPDSADVGMHVDVGGIDETYQVERRMLEMALQKTTERAGVDIFKNHLVRIKDSTIERDDGGNEIVAEGPEGQEVRFRAPVVCDASGSASIIPRHLGIYRKNVPSFQTSAYFAYFKQKSMPSAEHWDFGVSRHLCFPEGWWWFISLCSWERSSDEALSELIDFCLDFKGSEAEFPTRDELSEKFGAPYDMIHSIGVVPRVDLEPEDGARGPEGKFQSYIERYPGTKEILSHYELIEHYEDHAKYAAFAKMAHDCERFTGDGWLVIGDAAVFSNPLYAPGLNYGSGTAYMAAQATANALNRRDYSARSFATYDEYTRDVFNELLMENEMYYRSFKHPEMMERCLMSKFFFGTIDRIASRPGADDDPYTPSEPYIFDLLNPRYTSMVRQVVDIMRADEEAGVDPAKTNKSVRAVIDPFLADLAQMPSVKEAQYGRFFTHYTDDLKRSPKKNKSLGRMITWQCPGCKTFVMIKQDRCHVCGTMMEKTLKRRLVRMRLPG
jgi:flavin-dependent dehydrogenase/CRP-like cAMP-binding protein